MEKVVQGGSHDSDDEDNGAGDEEDKWYLCVHYKDSWLMGRDFVLYHFIHLLSIYWAPGGHWHNGGLHE